MSLVNSSLALSRSILQRSAFSVASLSNLEILAISSFFCSSTFLCLSLNDSITRSWRSYLSLVSILSCSSNRAIRNKCYCSFNMILSLSKLDSSIRFLLSLARAWTYFSFSSYKEIFYSWSSRRLTKWSFSFVLTSSSYPHDRNTSLTSDISLSKFKILDFWSLSLSAKALSSLWSNSTSVYFFSAS